MEYLIMAALAEIERQMGRLYWNKNQKEMVSPFENTGEEYKNDTFFVRAYNWNDDDDGGCNFKYKDLSIWWYKHYRRGIEWMYEGERNVPISAEFLSQMLDDCIISVQIDWDTI